MKKIIGIVLGMSLFISMLSAANPLATKNPENTTNPVTTGAPANLSTFVPSPGGIEYLVSSVLVSNKKISMGIKDRVKINICEIEYNNNYVRDSKIIDEVINNGEISFGSRNKKVATVSKKGVIKAKSEGKAIILVGCGAHIPGGSLRYVEVEVIGNAFATKECRLKTGRRKVLRAVLGKEKRINFRVCNKNIIKVVKTQPKKLVIEGVKKGKTFVIATADGKKAKCKVIVE